MAASVSNYNGTNVTRLHVSQIGANETTCTLAQPLIDDAETAKYTVSLERLYLNAHIPIFPANTTVFEIVEQLANTNVGDPVDESDGHMKCIIGPVYNFLDFCQQIQVFCDRYNAIEANNRISVNGYMASKKVFALNGNEAFWTECFLRFPDNFGRMWEVKGTEGSYNERASAAGFADQTPVIHTQGGQVVYNALLINNSPAVAWGNVYPTPNLTISFKNRSDFFENRVGIRIDSVIPVPFETFAVGTSEVDNTARGVKRHSFFEVDFPQEKIEHTLTTHTDHISDTFQIKQDLQSGIFELVANASNTLSKTMIPGQLQTHRFEILVVKKEINAQREIVFKAEPLAFEKGDFYMLSVLFTKQI